MSQAPNPQDLLDSLPEALLALDSQDRLSALNAAARALWPGCEPGRDWPQAWPGNQQERLRAELELTRQTGAARSVRMDPAASSELLLTPLAGGGVMVRCGGAETDQEQGLFESLTLGVVYQDASGQITRANEAAQRILGLTLAQLRGQDSFDPRWRAVDEAGEPLPGEQHPAQRALREGRTVRATMGVYNPKLEELRWLSVTAIVQARPGGAPEVYSVFEDVTEGHHIRQALRLSQARYDRLVEATSQYVWTNSAEGLLTGDQPGWQRLTGMTPEQYGDYGWTEAVHPEDRDEALAAWQRAVQERQPYQIEQRVRDQRGAYRHFQVRGVPLVSESGQILEWVGIHSDITALKQAETELRELNDALEGRVQARSAELAGMSRFNALLLDAAGEGIFGLDLDGRTSFVNAAATRVLGYTADEMIGQNQHQLTHSRHPDGSDYPQTECPIYQTLHDGQLRRVSEDTFWHQNGQPVPVEYTAAPLRGPDGSIQGAVVVFQDNRARLEVLRDLRRSNAELEQFAYVASHDLQEPLRTVSSYAELLARRYAGELDERAGRYLEFMQSGVARMQTLINDLLTYARVGRERPAPVPVDLNVVLERVRANLEVSLQESGARLKVAAPLPSVLSDPGSLEQVFGNLIGNALKFRQAGVTPVIRLSAARAGQDWQIEVADNGIGIAPEYQERIFGVFQRLHRREDYPGTGIGLAVVRRIVEREGGAVSLRSEPGRGSSFFLTLPAAPDATIPVL